MSTPVRCDGCGLSPRPSENGLLPLRRCSRCRKAWYHDAECQRKHYPQHRVHCVSKAAVSGTPVKAVSGDKTAIFQVELKEGRGRSVIASRSIQVGDVIAPSSSHGFFECLVPPVLTVNNRPTRCALCFGSLKPSGRYQYEGNTHSPQYGIWFCSTQCRERGVPWLVEEEQLVAEFCSTLVHRDNVAIFPTAILLFRIMSAIMFQECGTPIMTGPEFSLRVKIESLEHHSIDTSADATHHRQAITTMAMHLLRRRAHQGEPKFVDMFNLLSAEYTMRVVSKIKVNGFSICDGELVAIGIGLFDVITNMNHSCRPNVIQTFLYGLAGQLPLIRATACSSIDKDEEICISYTDNTCPRDVRRQRLYEGYHFWCKCQLCCVDVFDDNTVGLGCPNSGCQGLGRREHRRNDEWVCDACGHSDFSTHVEAMRRFQMNRSKVTLEEAQEAFKVFKSFCHASSWYVRESGEQLIQSLLDLIGSSNREADNVRLCSKALAVTEDVISLYSEDTEQGWVAVRHNILKYKAAKLRLYLCPDPRQSLKDLQDVARALSLYFPDNHELILGLRDCMSQAFK